MAQVINTNSLSLMTQNNLNKSQSALGTAIERLSSGLRINSAKDDAAGQAISNRFTSNITGLTQASRNANDGISVAQTTEGSLSEINNNLQRIRELTVQAQNGTNSSSDLDSIQDEITSRLSEIDRVSGQTQFNGVKVLASDQTMKIQVGSNDGETISIDLKAINADTLGLSGFNVNGKGEVANTAATTDNLKLAGFKANTDVGDAIITNPDGSVTYSKADGKDKATAADVLAGVKNDDVIIVADGQVNGLGKDVTGYTYDSDSNSYAFTANDVSKDNVLNKLAPNAGDTFTAKVTIGDKTQEVNISKDGSITSADGKALYLDKLGNLTQTGNTADTKDATWNNLIANTDTTGLDLGGNAASKAVQTTIVAGDMIIKSAGGDTDSAKTAAYNGAYQAALDAATGNEKDDAESAANAITAITNPATSTVNITGATVSADQMASLVKGQNFTLTSGVTAQYRVDGNTGAVSYDTDGTGGSTADATATAYVDNDGKITTDGSVSYYAQSNGAITNGSGSVIYKSEAGKLTTDATTKSESTADPLKALDEAISQIDSFRSSLGAVQNRFDSAITNLANTTTNLASAQSRIQDADYATEVSAMSKAQILQQAGTSVLAKANQVPQSVLSLLQ